MYKIEIKNAVVKDNGYGMKVNDKPLEEIISTLLGSYVKTKDAEYRATYKSNLSEFYSNSCDVTVIINPHPICEYLEDEETIYHSLQTMEDDKCEQFDQKCKTPDTEE